MRLAIAAVCAAALSLPAAAAAQERITYKSAKSTSSYYQMAVQLAEAVDDAGFSVTVEESQGSVQNVMEALVRGEDYVFTAPPSLVTMARESRGPFENRPEGAFDEIRALFPIPSLTMHFVVRGDAGAETFADLEGKTILLGQGSFGAREGQKYLDMFGLADEVTVADAELGNAGAALKNGQIDAFVTAGSFPAPNVTEAAAGTGISLISMTDAQVAETGRTPLTIPAGTYPGQDGDVLTTSLPVIAYATTAMSEETAYNLTKAYWEAKDALGDSARWWNGVDGGFLESIEGQAHPGALRYYDEVGITVPANAR